MSDRIERIKKFVNTFEKINAPIEPIEDMKYLLQALDKKDAQIARCKEGLGFYGDRKTYYAKFMGDELIFTDQGALARQTLKDLED